MELPSVRLVAVALAGLLVSSCGDDGGPSGDDDGDDAGVITVDAGTDGGQLDPDAGPPDGGPAFGQLGDLCEDDEDCDEGLFCQDASVFERDDFCTRACAGFDCPDSFTCAATGGDPALVCVPTSG